MKKLLLLVTCMFLCMALFAQRKLSGIVKDDKGNPVIGATVQVKGTKTGTSTRPDGTFSLDVPANAKTIVISYVGFNDREIAIGNQQTIDVSLAAGNTGDLGEVVVTGYGIGQRRKNVVASIASVNGKDLENKPFTSVDQMFAGKVAGLIAPSFSGQPGAAQQVRIRGIGSIAAGAGPLYVVDGVILNSGDVSRLATTANTLAGINANDIEDVTFLKDAQATSLYGSRAANGVIYITTKKGKAGKTKFRADMEIGFTGVSQIPEAARPLNADEWLSLFEEGMRNAGLPQATIDAQMLSYGKGSGINTDWMDIITRQGQQQQYNLSASGGEGKTVFYLSGGYFKQEASTIGSDFKRYSLTTNIKHTASDKLNFGLNLSMNNSLQNTPLDGGAFANPTGGVAFLRPTQNPYNADGTLNINRVGNTNFPSNFNPIYLVENDEKKLTTLQFRGNASVEYSILKNLKFSSRFGVDYNSLEEFRFDNPFHGDGRTNGGRGSAFYTRIFNWINTNQLIYTFYPDSRRNFRIEALAGYEAQKSKEYDLSAQSNGYPPTSQLPYSTNAATVVNGKLAGTDYAFNSIISTASVNYKNKYVVNGSYRRDASSRFSENNRYGNFWSAGAAWNVDRESFFPVNNVINAFKIRGSYGRTGNAGIGNYAWRQTFGYGANYNSQPGGTFNTIGNSDLTWEGNTQLDIGIDAGFWKNRLNIVVDYYKRISDGLLFADPLSPTTGFVSITRNIGEMQNKGFEFTLNATPINTKDFKWDVSFNISFNKNKITKLPGHKDIIDATLPFILREGYDYRSFYGRVYIGADPANGDPLWYKDSTHTSVVNNRSLATRELLKGKSASPKAYGGLSTSFNYRGFAVTADFIYNYGNYVTDGWAFYLIDGIDPIEQKYALNLRRWQKPGDITDVPKYIYGSTNSSSSFSTRFLQKGDYIRLRNITLGYTVDGKVTSKLHLSNVNIYVRGTNLWTKTYDKNLTIDPEQGVNSSSNLDIYYNKTITFGVSVGF
ncbi:MAG: SusC/RagA family TonB-linked outer membrane protein [Bacteroidetes bacterium]|jgi:TonB-linked SusC/RagA family outer membrane protein|nr:MAG: SusC/RagA family TonB-linked outer membrane protein [Bacteroidota bacterium]